MNAIGGQILVGVCSGLVTGIVILVFTQIWQKILVPWYEQRIYRGVHIDGTWTLEDIGAKDSGWSQREILIIKQIAHRLSGNQLLYPKEDSTEGLRTLELTGEIRDSLVTFQTTNKDPKGLSRGVFLGEVRGGGIILQGEAVFMNVLTDEIQGEEVKYLRQLDVKTT